MRTYMVVVISFCCFFVAGCIAVASEQATKSNSIQLTWETLLTIYGPMAVWLIWFIRRDDQRRKEDAEHRREWVALVQNNTEALTNVNATLTLTRVDDEKNRLATYRLAEEIKEVCIKVDGICDGMSRGNTRVMTREE